MKVEVKSYLSLCSLIPYMEGSCWLIVNVNVDVLWLEECAGELLIEICFKTEALFPLGLPCSESP